MKLLLDTDRGQRELALERTGSDCRFRLDSGDERTADVARCEPGVYSILLDGKSYEARVESHDDGYVVVIEGHRFCVAVADPRRWSHGAARRGLAGRQSITAPMPGKVVRILVSQGQAVEAGSGLVVIEAMKMQNEMKAPKEGHVASIPVREGQTVGPGEVLAIIE